MPSITIATAPQLIVGLGLLNVWLLRPRRATSFRGGDARSLKEEFLAYGLPSWFFYLVGFLKVGSAVALLAGLWVPALVLPAAAVVATLMVGAILMHIRVGDAPVKSLPALVLLIASSALCGSILID